MKQNLFDMQQANRILKLQFVAGGLGVAVAMPNHNSKNVNRVANELSDIIINRRGI